VNLVEGVKIHGLGQWALILRDCFKDSERTSRFPQGLGSKQSLNPKP